MNAKCALSKHRVWYYRQWSEANCAEECAYSLQKDQDRLVQGDRYNPLTSFALFSTGPLFNV